MTEEREEFVYTIEEAFETAQKAGRCGERQNNGRRCTNPILEWFDLDPDRPNGPRVGACGVHLEDVARRVSMLRNRVYERRLETWTGEESMRIARALIEIGLKIKLRKGYRSEGTKFEVNNPGEFLSQLADLGVLEKFNIDLNAPVCLETRPHREYIVCQKYKDHEGNHDDLDGEQWPQEKKPEPIALPASLKPKVEVVQGGEFT